MLPGFDRPDDAPGSTQSLYRKYRPTTFDTDDLVGQEHVSRTLRNAIARGRVAHAYLFCGPRGTGKTSTARLLAKAVNCLDADPEKRPCNQCEACRAINEGRATDIIEIDAASNRGIDDIRDLRERVRYAPTQLTTKFYIIDEAHQITKEAFNAFLKTLEEPPPNTTFVLATTDPDRLPDTIASRCQRFDFRRIPVDRTMEHLRAVADREGISIDDEAIAIVARQATGSLRDALSMLDLLATSASQLSDGVVDAALTRQMLGLSQDNRAIELVRSIAARDIAAGLAVVSAAVDAGQDMRSFGRHITGLLRTLMLVKAGARPVDATSELEELAATFTLPGLLQVNRQFSEVDFAVRNGGIPQLPIEIAFVASIVDVVPNSASVQHEAPARRTQTIDAPPVRPAKLPPRQEQPPRSIETRQPVQPRTASNSSSGMVDASVSEIAANWERIRTEVKAVDRKAEALLASTDPLAFDGSVLTIVATYPFHVGRLNDPRMRQVVEDAVSRTLGGSVRIEVVLKSDSPAPHGQTAPPRNGSGSTATLSEPTAAYTPQPSDGSSSIDKPVAPDRQEDTLVRGAKAIFDAEEVE